MKNEIETIDVVKGEWRTVTKASQIEDGQRIRYCLMGGFRGYTNLAKETERNRFAVKTLFGVEPSSMKGFNKCMFQDSEYKNIQAFFPLPVRKSHKVAKVLLAQNGELVWFFVTINKQSFNSQTYLSRKSAISGARRFCKAIGLECEIVK